MFASILLIGLLALPAIDPAVLALVGTLFGGIGLKATEKFLNRRNEAKADRREARRDLNAEVDKLLERVDTLEAEVTEWRNRYYKEQEARVMLRLQIIKLGHVPADNIAVMVTDEDGTVKDTFTA